jgi:hypothetical protein
MLVKGRDLTLIGLTIYNATLSRCYSFSPPLQYYCLVLYIPNYVLNMLDRKIQRIITAMIFG